MIFEENSKRFIEIDSVKLAVFNFSFNEKNPYAIILHGVRADTDRILPIIKLLEDKYNVISIDLPGYGESTRNICTDSNYIDYCCNIFTKFVGAIHELPLQKISLFGTSLGANIIIEYLLKNPEQEFKRIGLLGPSYSNNAMSISNLKKRWTLRYLKEFTKNKLPTRIFQKVINSDFLFKIFTKTFDKESRNSKKIFEYEKKEWRLMTIQHLARSNYDLLQKDYSKVTKQVLSKNITFAYPEFDEYIDVNKTAEGFKRIFPNAKFNKYNSKEHMPRGNFLNDENLMYTFHQIVTAIQ